MRSQQPRQLQFHNPQVQINANNPFPQVQAHWSSNNSPQQVQQQQQKQQQQQQPPQKLLLLPSMHPPKPFPSTPVSPRRLIPSSSTRHHDDEIFINKRDYKIQMYPSSSNMASPLLTACVSTQQQQQQSAASFSPVKHRFVRKQIIKQQQYQSSLQQQQSYQQQASQQFQQSFQSQVTSPLPLSPINPFRTTQPIPQLPCYSLQTPQNKNILNSQLQQLQQNYTNLHLKNQQTYSNIFNKIITTHSKSSKLVTEEQAAEDTAASDALLAPKINSTQQPNYQRRINTDSIKQHRNTFQLSTLCDVPRHSQGVLVNNPFVSRKHSLPNRSTCAAAVAYSISASNSIDRSMLTTANQHQQNQYNFQNGYNQNYQESIQQDDNNSPSQPQNKHMFKFLDLIRPQSHYMHSNRDYNKKQMNQSNERFSWTNLSSEQDLDFQGKLNNLSIGFEFSNASSSEKPFVRQTKIKKQQQQQQQQQQQRTGRSEKSSNSRGFPYQIQFNEVVVAAIPSSTTTTTTTGTGGSSSILALGSPSNAFQASQASGGTAQSIFIDHQNLESWSTELSDKCSTSSTSITEIIAND